MKYAVMLKPSWPATFHRSLRDEKKQPLRMLEFTTGEPVLLDEQEYAAVKNDIGVSLVHAQVDSDGNPIPRPAKDQSVPSTVGDKAPVAETKSVSADIEHKPAEGEDVSDLVGAVANAGASQEAVKADAPAEHKGHKQGRR